MYQQVEIPILNYTILMFYKYYDFSCVTYHYHTLIAGSVLGSYLISIFGWFWYYWKMVGMNTYTYHNWHILEIFRDLECHMVYYSSYTMTCTYIWTIAINKCLYGFLATKTDREHLHKFITCCIRIQRNYTAPLPNTYIYITISY